MKIKIEPVLQLEDIAEIFRVSAPTVNRWLAGAKRGENNFPLPINTPGRKRVWNRAAIENFVNENQQVITVSKMESPSKRQARHEAAMQSLSEKHGIKVKPQKRKEVAK